VADRITVLLADDHSLVRRGFRRLLEDDLSITVVGEASDGAEAVELACRLRPRVVVMDCAMPKTIGLEATRQILAEAPDTAVLMLSMHSEETLVRQALAAGARGYILRARSISTSSPPSSASPPARRSSIQRSIVRPR
jgi:DNA-binding NarL/FixJ family response regulator